MAELIRQGIEGVLGQETAPSRDDSVRCAVSQVVGRFRSSRHDIAQRHDDYLGEAFAK